MSDDPRLGGESRLVLVREYKRECCDESKAGRWSLIPDDDLMILAFYFGVSFLQLGEECLSFWSLAYGRLICDRSRARRNCRPFPRYLLTFGG